MLIVSIIIEHNKKARFNLGKARIKEVIGSLIQHIKKYIYINADLVTSEKYFCLEIIS